MSEQVSEQAKRKKLLIRRQEMTRSIVIEQSASLAAIGMNPEHFQEAAVAAILANPNVLNASEKSFAVALRCSVRSGLIPDGREAAIIPFKNQAKFVPMKEGMAKVFTNATGAVLRTGVVYANDKFDCEMGLEPKLEHKPEIMGERGEMIAAYAIAIVPNKDMGRIIHIKVMGMDDLNKAKSASAAKSGPWITWFSQMCEKTVLKSLLSSLAYLLGTGQRGNQFIQILNNDQEFSNQAEAELTNSNADDEGPIIIEQEPEKQEPEKQEPEKQEPEKQEPEKQEPEKQEPEKQEPEKQEPEKQEPEKQEPEKQEPEKQEPEGEDDFHGFAESAEGPGGDDLEGDLD